MLKDALRLIRVYHNLKQTQLAKKLGISCSYLSEIESGKKSPSLDLISKYSEVFSVPPSSILYFSERLADGSLAEKVRVNVANKILKILNWISDIEATQDGSTSKNT